MCAGIVRVVVLRLPPHSKSIARSPRAQLIFLDGFPGVCSLRSLHPRLYALVRSAHFSEVSGACALAIKSARVAISTPEACVPIIAVPFVRCSTFYIIAAP